MNKQTNQIRLDKSGYAEYKSGKGTLFEKIAKPLPKFPKSVMVAGGVSFNGVGKLIFVTGTMTSFSYLQALEMYKDDINRLGKNLYFQQDNAPCHRGKKSLDFIKANFSKSLEFWPPNSPDLSPIEELWAILVEKLNKYSFEDIDEMAKKLQWLWNRVPKSLCKNLINSFDKKMELIKEKGERANKRSHSSEKSNYSWKNSWNNNDKLERIIYNKKILEDMKEKKLRFLKRQLKEVKAALIEEKKRYSTENKKKIKDNSFELYKFFLSEEKRMYSLYNQRIKEFEDEIKKLNELKGKELFDLFSEEEKINNIKIDSKGLSSASTNIS